MLLAHISLVIVFVFVFSHRKVLVNISKTEIRPNFCSASSGYQISGSSDKPRWAGWEFLCCWLGLRTSSVVNSQFFLFSLSVASWTRSFQPTSLTWRRSLTSPPCSAAPSTSTSTWSSTTTSYPPVPRRSVQRYSIQTSLGNILGDYYTPELQKNQECF